LRGEKKPSPEIHFSPVEKEECIARAKEVARLQRQNMGGEWLKDAAHSFYQPAGGAASETPIEKIIFCTVISPFYE
jgi:hypothetical protein